MSAASDGVAIPPAAKFTTGNVPVSWIWRINSYGAPRCFAAVINSSAGRLRMRRISPKTVRAWRTASTTLPVPASPLVRIIAAPSEMRRSASPRLRQPQTNGTLNACLSMWCTSSAGVSTSDSST